MVRMWADSRVLIKCVMPQLLHQCPYMPTAYCIPSVPKPDSLGSTAHKRMLHVDLVDQTHQNFNLAH